MNQVGEIKVLSLSVVPPASAKVYSYVWNFWDGTVAVTTVPSVEKKLNMGGNPKLAGRKLTYTCIPVLEDGQSTAINGEVMVNNPPSIVPSPTVSVNDRYFPFATSLTVSAYDLENDPLSFFYYLNGTALGGGTTTAIGTVNGTWNGTYAGNFNGYRNVFNTTVLSDREITAYVVDNQGGTTMVDFHLRGRPALPPQASAVLGLMGATTDATNVPITRIGESQSVNFGVYAKDEAAGAFSFQWTFAGSHGWTTLPVYSSGTTTALPDGGYRNAVERAIAGETEGYKVAVCRVTNVTTHKFVDVQSDVQLLANHVATNGTLAVKVNGVGQGDPITASIGDKLEYDLTVTDPDADIVTYKWTFTFPVGVIPSSPPTLTRVLWGPKIVFDTTGWPPGSVQATVVAYDRLGGETTAMVPLVSVS